MSAKRERIAGKVQEWKMSAKRERIAGKVQGWYDKRAELEASGWGSSKEDLLLLLKAVLCTVDVEELKQKGYGPLHYLADAEKRKETRCSEVKGPRMLEDVKLLEECGLSVDTRRDGGSWTALHQAAQRGNFDLVKGLVEAGADVNLKDHGGTTPLRLAAHTGHPMIVWYLLKHGAKWEGSYALHSAAWNGRPSSVKMLLKAGANVFEKDPDGYTAAQICCRGKEGTGSKAGRAEALSILLKKGADVKVKDKRGSTLLHLAACFGNEQCIPILVGRGLQADARSNELVTPLHFASLCGHLRCVNELIRRGTPLDAVDTHGGTSLTYAIVGGHVKVVSELIRADASVDVKDKNSITALHVAAALGSIKMAYLLVEGGAAVDALTDDGESPLVSCMRPGEGKIAQTLESLRTSPGEKEAREKVARFLLKMGTAVDEKVMKAAGEAGFSGVISSFIRTEREGRNAVTDRLHTVSEHYSSMMAGAEDEKADSTVRVRLVNTRSGEKGEKQYVLNIPLMKQLAARVSVGEKERAKISTDQASAVVGILPNMLDPRKYGYKGDDEDEGEEKGAVKGKKEMKRVELKYDGVDFTEEGFEAVVQFVTTGSVEELLTRRPGGGGTEGGASSNSSGRRGDGGKAEGKGRGGKKRKRVKLFDDVRAKQAVQAAEFFCLEVMSREVKTLIREYGFELEQNETERDEEEGPSRKRSRADP